MTDKTREVGEFIEAHPYENFNGTKKQYFEHLGSLLGMAGLSVKDYWYKYRLEKGLVVTKEVINPNGGKTITKSFRNLNEVDKRGLQVDSVTELAWGGINVKYKRANDITIEQLEEVFEKVSNRVKLDKITSFEPVTKTNDKILRVIITDEHVGLDVEYGQSIFNYHYDAKAYKDSIQRVFSNIIKEYNIHGAFDEIHLIGLGDAQDGQNKKTTRNSHDLTQNLSNEEVFDLCLETRIQFVKSIKEKGICKKIKTFDVTNDNHSGSFGYYVSSAASKILGAIYEADVECVSLKKFLDHYTYGDHAFILTHGKDKEYMRSGLPVHLNDKIETLIRDYIDHHNIDAKYIQLNKGDSHRIGYSRCKKFEYLSFGSFAPPSGYIQTNFGDSYSCYAMQVVPKGSRDYSSSNYFLDYTV